MSIFFNMLILSTLDVAMKPILNLFSQLSCLLLAGKMELKPGQLIRNYFTKTFGPSEIQILKFPILPTVQGMGENLNTNRANWLPSFQSIL